MNYVESDVPHGMTLAQWRKPSRPARSSRHWWRWLVYGRPFLNLDAPNDQASIVTMHR